MSEAGLPGEHCAVRRCARGQQWLLGRIPLSWVERGLGRECFPEARAWGTGSQVEQKVETGSTNCVLSSSEHCVVVKFPRKAVCGVGRVGCSLG